MKIGHLFYRARVVKFFLHAFQLNIYALIADEWVVYGLRKRYTSYFAADRRAA